MNPEKKNDGRIYLCIFAGLASAYLAEVGSSFQGIWMILGGVFLTIATLGSLRNLRMNTSDPSKASPMAFPILVFLLVLLVLLPVGSAANAIRFYKAENNVSYSVKKETATVYKVYGSETSVVLSDSYEGKPVTVIGKMALYSRRNLQSVVLPSGIKKIDNSAFMLCKSLTEIELPEGLEEIGRMAFRKCKSLQRIYIPASVTKIPRNAFQGCSKDLVIVGEPGSAAQTFAEKYFTFEARGN